MLGLQTATLENQAIAYNDQVRQAVNEVLSRELKFYYDALNSIATSASVLAGFSFAGMCMGQDAVMYRQEREVVRIVFNTLSALAMVTNLVTACAGMFVAVFSIRLALRGGKDSVFSAVKAVRGEYKLVLYLFLVAIELFISAVGIMGFYKFDYYSARIMLGIASVSFCAVLGLFNRAKLIFFLEKHDRFYGAGEQFLENSMVHVYANSTNRRSANNTTDPSSHPNGSHPPSLSSGRSMMEPSLRRSASTPAEMNKQTVEEKNPDPLMALRVLNKPRSGQTLWKNSMSFRDPRSASQRSTASHADLSKIT